MNAPSAPFPLSLEGVFFTKTVVIAIPGHERTGGKVASPPEYFVNVEKAPNEERKYVVTTRALVNSARSAVDPYFVEMECVAVFAADESLSEPEAKRGATITGHNVTIGAIREAVGWITGRHAYGPFMLGLSVLNPQKPPAESRPPPGADAGTASENDAQDAGGQAGGQNNMVTRRP
jgi:hypothetical protein